VNGFCIPENGGGECDAGYPNVPEPPNTYGWSCSTMGWGEGFAIYFIYSSNILLLIWLDGCDSHTIMSQSWCHACSIVIKSYSTMAKHRIQSQ
jgi:hypothetical protein